MQEATSLCDHYDTREGSSLTNQVGTVILKNVPIVSLLLDGVERLCLAQISNTLLRDFTYNEIHNRRVALGITCIQCTPVQLEILRRAGAMPVSSRRCGMITKREAQRLVKSFLEEPEPPQLPDNFSFDVYHECGWGCQGKFVPSRYNSSRAKCIKCVYCNIFFSPNKFIFHCHKLPSSIYHHPDAANFNSWRRHLRLHNAKPEDELAFAWEDVKAMFNGGSRRKVMDSPKDEPDMKISNTKSLESGSYNSQPAFPAPFTNSSMITPNPYDLFRHFPIRPMVSPIPETDWTKYTDLLRMRAMVGQYNFWSKPLQEVCYPKPELPKKSGNNPHQLWRGFLDDDQPNSPKVVEITDAFKRNEVKVNEGKVTDFEGQKCERGSRKSKPRKCDLTFIEEKRGKFSDDDDDVDLGQSHRNLLDEN